MSLIINHNLSAMQTNRSLGQSSKGLSKSLEKLSSGYRINVAGDDPSGLIISEQLRSQIAGVERAIQNSSEASNLIGLTEGALIEMNEILKKMRSLAIHAANSGITSPEQVRADQAEVDSGIQTLDRIANTTRYSDQYILNGSKQLVYDRNTQVKTTMDHTLINMEASRVDQIFKREGVKMNFAYAGTDEKGYADDTNQAKRAYLEASNKIEDPHNAGTYIASEAQYNNNGVLTAQQEFILTGSKGTKLFTFTSGEHLGQIAESINNIKDSLGIAATLVFNVDARIDLTANSTPTTQTIYRAPDWADDTPALTEGSLGAGSAFAMELTAVDDTTYPKGFIDNGETLARYIGVDASNLDDGVEFEYQLKHQSGNNWTIDIIANTTPPDSSVNVGSYTVDLESGATTTLALDGMLTGLQLEFTATLDHNADDPLLVYTASAAIDFEAVQSRIGVETDRANGDVQIYGANINGGPDEMKVTGVTVGSADDFRVGLNTDGDGRVYAKVVKFNHSGDYEVEWYKDKDCTMMIGSSSRPNSFSATNNSGISNNGLAIALTNNALVGDVYTVGLVGQEFTLARDSDGIGGIDQPADFNVEGIGGWVGMTEDSLANCVISGVDLGRNTSAKGTLYFEASGPANDRIIRVYKDANKTPASLVAEGRANLDPIGPPPGQSVIRLEEVLMDDGTWSGLNMTIPFDGPAASGLETGTIDFTNVGLRLYSTDYGSSEAIRIQNREGTLFHQYRFGDTADRSMVKSGTTVEVRGQDAKISMNGSPVYTLGLTANVTTPDFAGSMRFNGGVLGMTTIAVAGYENGKLFSRIQALQAIEENEEKMRLTSLALGYTIQPPQSNSGKISGITTGTGNKASPNSGELTFDFSKIDIKNLATQELRDSALAAFNSGLDYQVWRNGDQLSLRLKFNIIDTSTTPPTERYMDDTEYVDVTLDIDQLNSVDGFTISAANIAAAGLDASFLHGMVIKGNQISNIDGLEDVGAGATTLGPVYRIATSVDEPSFDALLEVNTYATNPRHATSESLENFVGGMQFQLGGNEGDQDRTIYSIQSMVMANVGRLEWNGKVYTLQDVLGSGQASLIRDPVLAMRIIGQAVDDVTTLRARLGAFQKNMLQTNINSLEVSVENLTKTESAIRDADMASESTEYTKNQILVQAGTAMLAQANQVNQNVLTLLGR